MKPRNAPLSSTSTSSARPAAINWSLRPSVSVLFLDESAALTLELDGGRSRALLARGVPAGLRATSRVLFSPARARFGFRTESLRDATVVCGTGGGGVSKLCRGGAGAGESAAGGEPESGGAGAGSGVIGAGSGATGTDSGTTGGGSCAVSDAESSPASCAGPASAPGSTVSVTAIKAAQARGCAGRPLTNCMWETGFRYLVLPPPRARAPATDSRAVAPAGQSELGTDGTQRRRDFAPYLSIRLGRGDAVRRFVTGGRSADDASTSPQGKGADEARPVTVAPPRIQEFAGSIDLIDLGQERHLSARFACSILR